MNDEKTRKPFRPGGANSPLGFGVGIGIYHAWNYL